MLLEHDLVPFHASPPQGEKVLVLAPHPDDETLGAGGAIRLLVEMKKHVKVVFLTSGEMAAPQYKKGSEAYASLRESEAAKALSVIGVKDYSFLRFKDRGLSESIDDVFEGIRQLFNDTAFDTLYCTSPLELNPDHRAAASVAMHIQEDSGCDVVFYEITSPLRPNILVDITQVYKRKARAMKAYSSQLTIKDYKKYSDSMGFFRTLTLEGAKYAEAFWKVSAGERDSMRSWMQYAM